MGLFDFMKKRDDEPTAPAPVQHNDVMQCNDVLLQALLNGETITREKVLTLPAVNSAVDFISNTIASMPVKLYKQKQGKVEEIEGDDRTKYLNSDTGDTLDGFQLKKAMVSDYLLGKGGYCYIKHERNEVVGLFYVADQAVSIRLYSGFSPIEKDYQIEVSATQYEPYEFIKLLRNTKDGASGVGLTVEVSKALETAYQTLAYQLGMVSIGGNKRGFLKAQRKLGADEVGNSLHLMLEMFVMYGDRDLRKRLTHTQVALLAERKTHRADVLCQLHTLFQLFVYHLLMCRRERSVVYRLHIEAVGHAVQVDEHAFAEERRYRGHQAAEGLKAGV
jgi:hypothetical protein